MIIQRFDRVPSVEAVRALAERAEAADDVAPLNEDALLALPKARLHLLALDEDTMQPLGYATIDRSRSGQLVVDPDHRRQGIGRKLAHTLSAPTGWWAFGNEPGAQVLAKELGTSAARTLLQMTRDLDADPLGPGDVPPAPEGIRIAPFRPGQDEETFLAVNAAAFAHHPEQGQLTLEQLREREAEPWFDPDGFLLAWRGDELVGFHWTKQESPDEGEVYVIAVAPSAQGLGLGRVLLGAGLAYLARRGVTLVRLFVEQSEPKPVALYESSHFEVTRADVWYADPRAVSYAEATDADPSPASTQGKTGA